MLRPRFSGAVLKLAIVAGLLASSAMCAHADPADPDAVVPRARYRSITSGLKSYRPVDPKPWGATNQNVMPKPKANLNRARGGKR